MGEALIFATGLFGGAALALGGFALGQLAERRRWMEWIAPRQGGRSVTRHADGAVTYRESADA